MRRIIRKYYFHLTINCNTAYEVPLNSQKMIVLHFPSEPKVIFVASIFGWISIKSSQEIIVEQANPSGLNFHSHASADICFLHSRVKVKLTTFVTQKFALIFVNSILQTVPWLKFHHEIVFCCKVFQEWFIILTWAKSYAQREWAV